MKKIRIGSGAGYAGDRIEPAIDLIEQGQLDYIIFECLAERTISLAQKAKQSHPALGYNELFEYRFEKILDALKEHKRLSCFHNLIIHIILQLATNIITFNISNLNMC